MQKITRESAEKLSEKPKVKWAKASNKEVWRSFDHKLHTTLQNSLKGSTTSKLNIIRCTFYQEGKERCGQMPQKRSLPKQSGRGEREILQLVKEHRPPQEVVVEIQGPRKGELEELVGPDQSQARTPEMS